EAIGRHCLPKLATLLNASNDEVRLRAARCALSLGDDGALEPLRAMAMDETSRHRLEALDAVVTAGRRNDATTLARRLLRDRDAQVVLAAYEHLRKMEDVAVRQEFVGRSFYLEAVVQTDRRAIFVARSGDPRIVIFGSSLTCRDNVFVESPDGMVVVDSRAGQDYATLTRRVANRPGVIGPIRSGLTVGEIIRALGSERRSTRGGGSAGLGACYGDVAAVLEQLCAKGGVAAEFWAGPLPKIGLIVKK
ncbi:MAG: HEAT repeat domain-containing protein, partial [Planctomycetota bacterium]